MMSYFGDTLIYAWLFNVYCSSLLLTESDTAQRSHSIFASWWRL